MDYKKIGLNRQLRRDNSLAARSNGYELAITNDLTEEKNPLKQNIIVTKQLYQSTLGGSVQFLDATGGTVILSYNPDTGTITLNGGIIVNQSFNIGTITNTLFTGGTINSIGTINNGVFGTPGVIGGTIGTSLIQGGTINNAEIGTPRFQAGSFGGTSTFPINVGSPALGSENAFEIQTRSGTVQIAIRSGTNT